MKHRPLKKFLSTDTVVGSPVGRLISVLVESGLLSSPEVYFNIALAFPHSDLGLRWDYRLTPPLPGRKFKSRPGHTGPLCGGVRFRDQSRGTYDGIEHWGRAYSVESEKLVLRMS